MLRKAPRNAVIALTEERSTAVTAEPSPPTVLPGNLASPAAGRIGDLVAREYVSVWRFMRRLGVPQSEVDDAAQRVFARVLAQSERIRPGAERAYLMRAAFRAALEVQRTKKRWLARASDIDIDDTAAQRSAPDQSLVEREELALLDRALAQLPPDLRAVLTLFEIEELTFSEISVALNLPRGTVASRVRRARERFRQAVRRLESGAKR